MVARRLPLGHGMKTKLRSIVVLPLVVISMAACAEPEDELDAVEDQDSDGEDDEFRWATVWAGHPTLVTSMNADWYGGSNGGCLDTDSSGNPRATRQYPCHARDNQLWVFEEVSEGIFRIHSEDDYGLCLNVWPVQTGTRPNMTPCHNGTAQRWETENHDPQSATIRPVINTGLCLDVRNGTRRENEIVQLFPCHGGANQAWRFHDYYGSDSTSCDGSIRFGAGGPTAPSGTRRSFAVNSRDVLCSDGYNNWDHIDCPSLSDWMVVDSPWGSDDFNVKCFDF